VALAASEFFSGILQTNLQIDYDLRAQKIEQHLDKILQALLECCVMAEADRMADLPTGHDDVGHVQAKNVEEDETENETESEQQDDLTTLRKSSAFTLQQFSKNFNGTMFQRIQPYL
jgi:hypothetical protein